MTSEFDNNFQIPVSLDLEKEKFVNRIELTIFNYLINFDFYESLLTSVCFYLGISVKPFIKNNGYNGKFFANLSKLTGNDFLLTLKVLAIAYKVLEKNWKARNEISDTIIVTIKMARIDLGIRWESGMFYPAGSTLLDKDLVDNTFGINQLYDEEVINFKKALEHLLNKSYNEAISNCFIAIEGIARKYLNNQKTLDNNKLALLQKLKLSNDWTKILSSYIDFAHKYGRHADPARHNINLLELESFIYLTGLMIRLIAKN